MRQAESSRTHLYVHGGFARALFSEPSGRLLASSVTWKLSSLPTAFDLQLASINTSAIHHIPACCLSLFLFLALLWILCVA